MVFRDAKLTVQNQLTHEPPTSIQLTELLVPLNNRKTDSWLPGNTFHYSPEIRYGISRDTMDEGGILIHRAMSIYLCDTASVTITDDIKITISITFTLLPIWLTDFQNKYMLPYISKPIHIYTHTSLFT